MEIKGAEGDGFRPTSALHGNRMDIPPPPKGLKGYAVLLHVEHWFLEFELEKSVQVEHVGLAQMMPIRSLVEFYIDQKLATEFSLIC